MSYDLRLVNTDGTVAQLSSDAPRGGTYALGGHRDAEFSITYNYSSHFRRVLGTEGIRTLYGKTGAESIPILSQAIVTLKNDVDPDYWKATEGNARLALVGCLLMACECPDAIWEGD